MGTTCPQCPGIQTVDFASRGDKNNFGPRTGFAYQVNDKTVVRGGWGVFFTQLEDDALHQSTVLNLTTNVLVTDIPENQQNAAPAGGMDMY